MALSRLFRSRRLKQLSVARLLFKSGRAFLRGEYRVGVGLLGAAALASKSTTLGFLAEGVLWFLRRGGRRGPRREEPPVAGRRPGPS
ncbi:hypothetical protein BRC81_13205 [Halobacteriales archaeon QS_1_68_20]|nr:MAG: hypothetical protein BRC81_13205 [Halobacteriales archaeon QS_1_68_20]